MAKVAFVVCGNGYGHLRRVTEVIREIHRLHVSTSILLAITPRQQEILLQWDFWASVNKSRIQVFISDLDHNLKATLPADYSLKMYRDSWVSLYQVLHQFNADKLVSDNLAGLLDEFPHAVLMGSFLWADCLEAGHRNTPEVTAICRQELELLRIHRPKMFGVADMVMPAVVQETHFQGLPWFCQRQSPARRSGKTPRVLVSGGGTKRATDPLNEVLATLVKEGGVRIFADRLLGSQPMWSNQVSLFDFSNESFGDIDMIFCRPGIGILTDAVSHTIPVCVIEDADKEMQHNAMRVESLSIGFKWNKMNFSKERILNGGRYRDAISALRTGGATEMAAWCLG